LELALRRAQGSQKTDPGLRFQRRRGMNLQQDLFGQTTAQKFDAWKASRGGRHVLRIAYILTAPYARRFLRTGRQVSIKLIWELMRDELDRIKIQFAARGVSLKKFDGFALNNIFTAHVARHIMSRRPDWDGLFATREINSPRPRRKIVIIENQRRKKLWTSTKSSNSPNTLPTPAPICGRSSPKSSSR
jgi:hypothetical protein